MRLVACLAALLVPVGPAAAAERTVTIGSIDRLRVEGTYKVTVRTGGPAGLTIAGDRVAIDAIDVRSDGGTLAIRAGAALTGGAPATRRGSGEPVTIVVSTPALRSVLVIGGANVAVGPMKAAAVDLSVSGTATLRIAAVEGERLAATLIGNGGITVDTGRAGSARLVNTGGGAIDAAGVQVGDLLARQDGAGAIRASARFTAQVVAGGLGSVTVAGAPRCTVRAPAGGSVTCGTAAGPAS